MKSILNKARKEHLITKDEIIFLLNNDPVELFKTADEVRREFMGDEVHLRALIELSNICKNNCLYCGIRKDNENVDRYRLSKEEVLKFAKNAKDYGFKTIVLQGGEDAFFTKEKMCEIITAIKKMDMALTLSLGEKSYEEYKAYKEAGANRYLLRIETTDSELYSHMHPNMSLETRKQCLKDLKSLGFETGSGCLVGLPNQTIESLADDILFFKELNIDMMGLGPFIPSEDTPLKKEKVGSLELALKVMAIVRLLLPDINIPATTAMETLHPQGRIMALQSGANVIMPNVTEGEYREKYQLYPGKVNLRDNPAFCHDVISEKISTIGRSVSTKYGFRGNKK